jgi:site-specific recombinase XerD
MSTDAISPLRQRMIEDMSARKLNPHTQRSHISSCKRFAAYLKRSPDTATADEIRLFQLHLTETKASICNRNRIMTGLRFLFRVTLRRLDLAAEIYHIKEPQKIPLVMSPDEAKRLLAMAGNLKVHVLCSSLYLILQTASFLEVASLLLMVVRQRSFFPSQSGWRQGMFAAASCRSTSGLDAVSPRCSF